jgi:hypothetical protein
MSRHNELVKQIHLTSKLGGVPSISGTLIRSRMMHLNDMTEMDFDSENEQIEDEAESLRRRILYVLRTGMP